MYTTSIIPISVYILITVKQYRSTHNFMGTIFIGHPVWPCTFPKGQYTVQDSTFTCVHSRGLFCGEATL